MKTIARITLFIIASLIAYFAALSAERLTGHHVSEGFTEGTPATVLVFFTVLSVTLIALVVIGHILINRWFSSKTAK